MALVAAGAAFVVTSGMGWYYWRGETPLPEEKKEHKEVKKSNDNKHTSSDFIKELQEVGRTKLKPVSPIKSNAEPSDLERSLSEIRDRVKLSD